eukprot:4299539-Pyramimonas_sp.AAC.1
MVRLSQSRNKDPVNRRDARARHGPTHGGLWEPSLAHKDDISGDAAARDRNEQASENGSDMERAEGDDDVDMAVPLE